MKTAMGYITQGLDNTVPLLYHSMLTFSDGLIN